MKNLVFVVMLLVCHLAWSQNTYTIKQCEEQFLKNNFMLLAEQFDVEASKAAVVQARIWDLPYIGGEFNLYNPSRPQILDAGKTGQKALNIQQIIYLGNKKKYQVDLAKTNSEMAVLEFEDLLRNLRFQLKQSFFNLYFKQRELNITIKQLGNLDTLVNAYAVQVEKGNIPMKDLVRLQSLYFNLRNDKTELIQSIINEQEILKIITGIETEITPVFQEIDLFYGKKNPNDYIIDSLYTLALSNRPDYKLAAKNIEAAERQLKLQKSLSVPDVTIGASYDQRGGAFNNQTNITFGIPLPLWNRNKGNILMAESFLKQASLKSKLSEQLVKNEVFASYSKWKEAFTNYLYYIQANTKTFETVYQGVISNFQKRNISIMEFTDFMESYNQSMQQFNLINKNLVLSFEEMNKSVNSNLK